MLDKLKIFKYSAAFPEFRGHSNRLGLSASLRLSFISCCVGLFATGYLRPNMFNLDDFN